VKKRRITLTALAEIWWSRKKENLESLRFRSVEEVARNYELLRRSEGGKSFKKTFLDLNPHEIVYAFLLWGTPHDAAWKFETDEKASARGWIAFDARMRWNLRLTDAALIRAFMRLIDWHRKAQHIRPKRNVAEKKNRGVSWRGIEILDCMENQVGTRNASDRHTASIAKQFLVLYERALKVKADNL
jgi:hypothetical protein